MYLIKLIILSLFLFSAQVSALTREDAKIKLIQQNNQVENSLIGMYKVLDYKKDSLRIHKELYALQERISKTYDKNELTRLYCVEYRKIKQQSLDVDKKFNEIDEIDEIYNFSLNELQKLITACRNNDITKIHEKENDLHLKLGKYSVDGFQKRELEYNQYNDTKNVFEDMLVIRKRMIEEPDMLIAQDILCIEYLGKLNELSTKLSVWEYSPLTQFKTQIKESASKFKIECQRRGY